MLEMFSGFDSLVDSMITPPRQEYTIDDLGLRDRSINKRIIHRKDFKIRNKRGYLLECSHFAPIQMKTKLPCVIYLHANGCSRLEALPYVDLVCRNDMTLFCFDFSGSGQSQGPISSIGWHEQEDLESVIGHLSNSGKANRIALWGRSMGAITSLLYAGRDNRISCMIVDSSFASFKQVVQEYTKKNSSLPSFLSFAAFGALRNSIIKKAGFDIELLEPINQIDKISIPALFAAGNNDELILPTHSKQLHELYKGTKQLIIFEGEHNSQRPLSFVLKAIEFLKQYTTGINEELPEELQKDSPTIKMELKKLPTKLAESKPEDRRSMKLKSRPQDDLKKRILTQQRPSLITTRNPEKIAEKESPQSCKSKFQFSWLEHGTSSPSLPLSQNNSPKIEDKKKNTPKQANSPSILQTILRDTIADENSPLRPNQSAEIKMTPYKNPNVENTGPRPRGFTENTKVTPDSNIRKNISFSTKNSPDSINSPEAHKTSQNQINQIEWKRPKELTVLKIDLSTPQNSELIKDLCSESPGIPKGSVDKKNDGERSNQIITNSADSSESNQTQSVTSNYISRTSYPLSATQKYVSYSPTYKTSKFSPMYGNSPNKASESDSQSTDSQHNFISNIYKGAPYQKYNSLTPEASNSSYIRKTYTVNESIFAKQSTLKSNDLCNTSEVEENSEKGQTQTDNTIPNQQRLSFTSRAIDVSSIKYEYSPSSRYQGYYTPKSASYTSYQRKSNQQQKMESLIKPYKFSDYTEKILESQKYQNKSMDVYANPNETSCDLEDYALKISPVIEESKNM